MSASELVTLQDIIRANQVLGQVVEKTPLIRDRYLSEKYECNVYLKREDLQIVRSFKLRGAYYAISQMSQEELANGVVCASAGNHAQGVAYTSNELNVPATIFMPVTTPDQKINQVKYFGGDNVTIKLTGDTFDQSANQAVEYAQENNMKFIHPFNNLDLIAGQGTVAVEIYDKLAQDQVDCDYLFCPIGGGGLVSGVATYSKSVSPDTQVVGVEASGASSMAASLDKGEVVELEEIDTFADGIAVARPGELTYQHALKYIDSMTEVDESAIAGTIIDLYTHEGIVAEPAGAASVTALDNYKDQIKGKNVVCIISGGNNDLTRMSDYQTRSEIYQGYLHYFLINFPQRPGALREFVNDIIGPEDDIIRFEYMKKNNRSKGPIIIGIKLKDPSTIDDLLTKIEKFNSSYTYLNENENLYTLLI